MNDLIERGEEKESMSSGGERRKEEGKRMSSALGWAYKIYDLDRREANRREDKTSHACIL